MAEKPVFGGRYGALNGYIAPVNPQLWRLAFGILVMGAVYALGITAYLAVLVLGFGADLAAIVAGSSPAGVVLLLFSSAFMAGGCALAAIWPARRAVLGLIGPLAAARRDFARTLLAIAPVMALFVGLVWAFDPSFAPHMPLGQVLPWLPLALLGLLIQTGSEELVFRGFIMGQLAARFSHPLAWMVLPSALFGALHYNPETYGETAWIVCALIAFMAILFSDLTARTGNLGAAFALHFGNNTVAFLVLGEWGELDGLSLFTMVTNFADPWAIAGGVLYMVILWLAIRLALRV